MSDYKIKLGVEVNTNDINTAIKTYKGQPIEVKSKLDTTGIRNAISNYKAKTIDVKAKLNTTGIARKIGELKIKTPVKVDAKLNTKSINTGINGYKAKPIKVNVETNFKGVATQIGNFSKNTKPIKLRAELNKGAIGKAVSEFNKAINGAESKTKTKIKIKAEPDLKGVNKQIKAYKLSPLRVSVNIKKADINKQIRDYGTSNHYITVKAKLDNGAINTAIRDYKTNTPIKIGVELDPANIYNKIKAYTDKGGVPIPARLVPISKGYDSGITKTPIKINAELNPENINSVISTFKPTSKINADVKLVPKDINAQIKNLPKIAEPINVGVKLNTENINADIALYQPTATLGIKPDLIIEDVESQISAYVPKSPLKVNVQINNGDIDNATKEQSVQKAIQVNVRLNPSDINKQVQSFKTTSKIKVGVKLDPKGVAEQIRKIQPKTKVKIGVQIDPNEVAQQVGKSKIDTAIKLNVELNEDNIWAQIDNIKRKLRELGNIKIDFGTDISDGITKKFDNVSTGGSYASNIAREFKEVDIAIKSTENGLINLRTALGDVGFNDSAIESITGDFKKLGATVTNVTSRLNKDGTVKLTVKGLDQFKNAVTYINNVGSDGKLGSWSQTISRDINKVGESFNRLKSMAKEIGNLKIDMFKTDDSNEIERMTADLNQLQKEYNELFASTQGGLNGNQLKQLDDIARRTEETLSRLKREYAETRAELAREIRGNFTGYDAQVQSLEAEMNKLANVTPQVEIGIKNVKQALMDMRNAPDNDSLIEAEQRLQNELKETLAQLRINQSAEEIGFYDDGLASRREAALTRLNGLFENGSQASKRFGAEAQKLRMELEQVGNVQGIENVNRKIGNLEKRVKNSGAQVKTLGTSLKEQFVKYSNYLSIYYVFMYATQALRSMFEQVKSIDSAMTELKKVTDETADSYNKFLSNAATRSVEIGTTIDGLVSSTADFARLGYGFEDAQGLAEVANIYAVVGDEVEGVEGATESLISTMAAFKDEMNGMSNSDFAMRIIDIYNELGNKFAISSGGLGEALERSASSLAAANNTLHESAALITAANTVVQNPEKVGTAFKTISMRIKIHCPH